MVETNLMQKTLKFGKSVLGGAARKARQEFRDQRKILAARAQRRKDWRKFELDRVSRSQKVQVKRSSSESFDGPLECLRQDGYVVLKGRADQGALHRILAEFNSKVERREELNPTSKDSARDAGDKNRSEVYLSREELMRGESYLRQHANHISVKDPFVACPATVPVAFDEFLLDFAEGYLGCFPSVSSCNLRKSFANNLPEFDTQYFHRDPNSPRFLKFFFYLNDVTPMGGPFCYVRGSHRKRFWREDVTYRWDTAAIEKVFGEENIMHLSARMGDVIVADVTGFHRGVKALDADRTMLTVNLAIHPEFQGAVPAFHLPQRAYALLGPKQKAAADLLGVV